MPEECGEIISDPKYIQDKESLKQILWLHHGHTGMYGDDGEMQCGACLPEYGFWDWKAIPISEILYKIFNYREVSE